MKINGMRIRELVRKEFIQLFRDRKIRPILIIAPIIQILIFGYVVDYDVRNIRLAILDQAQTRESRLIAKRSAAAACSRSPTFSDMTGTSNP